MKRKLLVLLLALALPLAACAAPAESPEATPAPAETPAPKPELPAVEFASKRGSGLLMAPMANEILFSGEYFSAEVNGNTYDFQRTLSEGERLAFIEAEEALLKLLGAETGLTVRVLSDYPSFSDSENRALYLGADACRSWKQAIATLGALEGDYTNYGYLYAKADRLCQALGWARDDGARVGKAVFTADPTLLNLVYPCFDETYCSAKQVAACKSLALSLEAETEAEFFAAVDAFAAERGLDFTRSELVFAPFGKACPLKLRTRTMEVFRLKSFKEDWMFANGFTWEDPLGSPANMLSAFSAFDEKNEALRERFAMPDAPVVTVRLIDGIYGRENLTYLSMLRIAKGEYYIDSFSALTLDISYASYLFALRGGGSGKGYTDWMGDSLTAYFTLDTQYSLFLMQTLRLHPEYTMVFQEVLGHSMATPEDYLRFIRISVRSMGVTADSRALYNTPELRLAFGEYFARTYGEDLFIACMVEPDSIQQRTGRTIGEIIADFNEDLQRPDAPEAPPGVAM